ncbi:MAG: transporter ATP-binding protein [Holophagaceae bacterium]|nr:transporter ATP-binding protein [Holophagaceae bacterium]
MIELAEVYKGFTVRDRKTRQKKRIEAVRGVSFSVHPGEIYGLLGPNGAGKSTTLRLIAGLMQAERGLIRVGGFDAGREPEAARACVGYLSGDLNVYGRFTPREFLRLFGQFQGMQARVAEGRALALLERLGLLDFMDVRMEGFSTGQKQKVSVARALLHDPRVVVFDEPTTGLDVLTAKTVLDLLRELRAEGRAVIVSTHVMPMVEDICDRVGILFDGVLYGDAPLDQLLAARHARNLDEVFFQLAGEA